MAEKYLVNINHDEDVSYELRRESGQCFVRREGEEHWKTVSLNRVGDSDFYLLMVDSRPLEIYLERRRGGADVTIGRHIFGCDVGPWRPQGARGKRVERKHSGKVEILAPMTGSIVEVHTAVGQAVERNDVLLVVESMKMNNELRSPTAGVLEAVNVVPAQRVKQGETLLVINTGQG